MFLESVKIIETSPCLAEKELFKAVARASVNLDSMLPFLNRVLEKAIYRKTPHSLVFKKGIIGITLQEDKVSLTRFVNQTEAFEILDWVKDMVNNTFDNQSKIIPDNRIFKPVGVLKVYSMLPRKNCGKCQEASCMAFAAKLDRLDADIDDCPVLKEPEFMSMREKLQKAFEPVSQD